MKTKAKIEKQKQRIKQSKNRLQLEESRIKERERKIRTRHLIEVGGLVAKAKLDFLDSNTLYGALLSLQTKLEKNESVIDQWKELGKEKFEIEAAESTPLILTFNDQPSAEIRSDIRAHNLKWNKFRNEWYGNVKNIDELKKLLESTKKDNKEIEYNIEVIG